MPLLNDIKNTSCERITFFAMSGFLYYYLSVFITLSFIINVKLHIQHVTRKPDSACTFVIVVDVVVY